MNYQLSVGACDSLSVDTEDAVNVVARIDFIIASLEKAGVPSEELERFKSVVSSLPSTDDVQSKPHGTEISAAKISDLEEIIAEGGLDMFQRGTQGFAPVWKKRWIKISPGKMSVFISEDRPLAGSSCLFSLPLSVQQTKLDPGKEALRKRFKRDAILMVSSSTSVGGTVRCVTLAFRDDFALEKWIEIFEKAMSQDGRVEGATIFRASQAGDILRVKELVRRGCPVNRRNIYGCSALHYAVKNAADLAKLIARGGRDQQEDGTKVRAQEALRVVVFLMSHGADARAVNHVGESPLHAAVRLTIGFPKARSLLRSVLDTSKYQVQGGAIYIVPGQPRLPSVEEMDEEASLDPRTSAVTARGVTFSPSRRDRKLKSEKDLADSRRPCNLSASPRPGEASESVFVLPSGDHERALGGPRHLLAADLGRRYRRRKDGDLVGKACKSNAPRGSKCHVLSGRRSAAKMTHAGGRGVLFRDFRMGRSSSVLVRQPRKRWRSTANRTRRPDTCPEDDATGQTASVRGSLAERRLRTATGGVGHKVDAGNRLCLERDQIGSQRVRARIRARAGGAVAALPDREARRQISEWLRESAGTAAAVPPAKAHGAGGHLEETSSYVATDRRRDVYRALQEIKGSGRGELISVEKLRATLCRVGQPLLPEEMDELQRDVDHDETGYISCSRFSKLVTSSRLTPLAKGALYNAEDDVVLEAKAKRLAKLKRLERTAVAARSTKGAASEERRRAGDW